MANSLPESMLRDAEPSLRRLMTTQELSNYLNVPPATLKWWRTHGMGPRAYRIGRQLRYRLIEVDAWVEDRADPPDCA